MHCFHCLLTFLKYQLHFVMFVVIAIFIQFIYRRKSCKALLSNLISEYNADMLQINHDMSE